jgi:hypothetical protein
MDGWDNKPDGWEKLHMIYDVSTSILQELNINTDIDGIFVLAGGIDKNGLCHEWVRRRLDLAYQIHKSNDKPIFCLGGGSYHISPILNKSNYVIHESTSCSEYLINLGVSPNKIYKEWSSYDTIANGFFGFTNFIIPLKLKSIVLITSEFHIPRSKAIFLWMKQIFNIDIRIEFLSAADENLDEEVIKSRTDREKKSLNLLKKNVINKVHTIEDFHKWFYTKHNAYCSNSELIRKQCINDKEKKSY